MGSKKLKGLVVTGSGTVDIPDRERFKAAKQMLLNRIKTEFQGWAKSHSRYETAADLEWTNEMGMIPTRNWQTGQFEGWKGIDKSTTPMGWPERARPCAPYCPTAGTREVIIQEGPYKGAHSDVEWETIYAFGSQCGVDKMEAVIAASQICDEFGIDTMTAGVTIGFAMECFEKGLIGLKETDGIEFRFGNDQAMLAMLGKLVRGEGFGKELAKGSRSALPEDRRFRGVRHARQGTWSSVATSAGGSTARPSSSPSAPGAAATMPTACPPGRKRWTAAARTSRARVFRSKTPPSAGSSPIQ